MNRRQFLKMLGLTLAALELGRHPAARPDISQREDASDFLAGTAMVGATFEPQPVKEHGTKAGHFFGSGGRVEVWDKRHQRWNLLEGVRLSHVDLWVEESDDGQGN